MPAPDRRLPRPILVLAPVLAILASATGPFDGCGGERATDPRPLPRDTAASCFDDSDCTPVGCEAVRCIAGSCAEVAPIRDQDGDGHAPPECGGDCDDEDATRFPGSLEICDLVDQDCDGSTDEGAAPLALRFEADTRDPVMLAFPWGEDVLVTDVRFSPGSLLTRAVSLDERTVGTSRRVVDLGDVTVVAAAGRPTTDGAVIALAVQGTAGGFEIVLVSLRRVDGDGVELVADPIRRASGDVSGIDVLELEGAIHVAWDEGTTRYLWSPAWADRIAVAEGLVEGLGPLDLATDGAHLVVPTGPRTLAFHTPDGALAGTQDTTGDLGPGLPIADDAGGVYAIVRDAFDHSVQRLTLGSAGRLTPALDAEPSTVRFGLDRYGTRLYVTRASSTGTIAGYADTSDLESYTSFPAAEVTGPRTAAVRSVTVLDMPAGPTIVTGYGDAGSTFTLLACRTM